MKRAYKKIIGLIVLLGIEIAFLLNANNIEMFFMTWVIIWLMFLVNGYTNIFRTLGNMSNPNIAGARAEIEYIPEDVKSRKPYLGFNIIYAILFLINLIGYIVVVVIKY